jgi:phospholipid/cholesterol/gamma-HCH transport system substrate-binding protein
VIRTALKFGAFVVVCLTFTLWLAFTIGNISTSDPLGRDNYRLTAAFDDVTGLLVNDNVKIAGVVVGKVTGIGVEGERAVVEFQVDDDIDLPTDTRAVIRWRNLIGQRYLYLEPGDETTTKLTDGDEVAETESVVDLGKLFNELGPIVAAIDPAKVNEFLDSVTRALDGREDDVSKVLDDLAVLAEGLGERDDAIARLVTNLDTVTGTIASRDAQIATMLDNLVLISRTFSANTTLLDSAITELGAFSEDLGFVLDDNRVEIDRLLSNLADVTDVVGGRLEALDVALANIDDAARQIFISGNKGEFLTQEILCAGVEPPDPAVCDVLAVKGAGAPAAAGSSAEPTGPLSGAEALLDLLGGDR